MVNRGRRTRGLEELPHEPTSSGPARAPDTRASPGPRSLAPGPARSPEGPDPPNRPRASLDRGQPSPAEPVRVRDLLIGAGGVDGPRPRRAERPARPELLPCGRPRATGRRPHAGEPGAHPAAGRIVRSRPDRRLGSQPRHASPRRDPLPPRACREIGGAGRGRGPRPPDGVAERGPPMRRPPMRRLIALFAVMALAMGAIVQPPRRVVVVRGP